MIRICHLTSAHNSNDTRIFYKECTSLATNGYEVYLVAKGDSRNENGVQVIGIGEAPLSRIKRMTSFANRAYKNALKLDCDIYHLHDPELLPYGLKLKKHGKKVIFDSHENTLEQMDEKDWIPVLIRKFVSKIYRLYATRVFKKLDGLISVTPHIVKQLKKINPNTRMITNYPIFKEYPKNQCSTEEINLCFTGGIDQQWSHETIIKSLGTMTGVQYNLCGSAEKEYMDKLRSLEGWNKVHFYGKVPFERAIEVQQQSSIGVALLQPSNNTGNMIGTLGNTKLFEYMMAELPIICTDFILWRKIVDNWKCGIYVKPNDIKEFTSAVEYLRDNPDEVKKMGENGRRAVMNKFNWKTQEIKLLKMYQELGIK